MNKQAQLKLINEALVSISSRMLSEGFTPELESALTYWTAKQMCALFAV
jgi:hypothetical protein